MSMLITVGGRYARLGAIRSYPRAEQGECCSGEGMRDLQYKLLHRDAAARIPFVSVL